MAENLPKSGNQASLALCDEAARFYQSVFSSIPLAELRSHLLGRRWFRSKGEKITSIAAVDAASASGTSLPAVLLFLRVEYENQGPEIYFVPYIVLDSQDAAAGTMKEGPLLNAASDGVEYLFFDAFLERNFNGWLFKQMREAASIATCTGAIKFKPEASNESVPGEVKKMQGEQSNTSLVAGKRFMLKIFRMADLEINPEAEMLRFLTLHGYKNIPQFRGDAVYQTREGLSSTFAILVDFVKSTSDGWEFTLRYLGEYYGRYAGKKDGLDMDAAAHDLKTFLPAIEALGRVTAKMHRVLASDAADLLFRPESATETDLKHWAESFTCLLERTSATVQSLLEAKVSFSAKKECREFLSFVNVIKQKGEAIQSISPERILKIRYHGDYHLGQVLKTEDSWCVTDFEGEPLRSIKERKLKTSPLKDVAGMLRSFSYAAYVSEYQYKHLQDSGNLTTLKTLWHDLVRGAFLNSYSEEAGGETEFFDLTSAESRMLLSFFELEKAIYELHYELNNRPDWIYVPLGGIKKLIC